MVVRLARSSSWSAPPAGRSLRLFRWLLASSGALLAVATLGCADPNPRAKRPDLLLVTVDTVRADRCSAYGHSRATTPFLDELASEGVTFLEARAPAPWTLPSLASIHTGLHPSEHGADAAEKGISGAASTLAEILDDHGYQTLGVVAAEFATSKHGFAQGFDAFDETHVRGHHAVTSSDLTATALAVLEETDERQPVFMWLHYFDPHFSYVNHLDLGIAPNRGGAPKILTAAMLDSTLDELRARGETFPPAKLEFVTAVYDEEIRATDRSIRTLVENADEARPERSMVVAVTADHGEYFLERGRFFHGRDVYDELVHVPLVLGGDLPEVWSGREIDEPVGLVDLGATLLERAKIDAPRFPGTDLFAATSGDGEPRPVYLEGSHAWGDDDRKLAVVVDDLKLIHRLDDDAFELYDVSDDPDETRNLIDDDELASERRALMETLEAFPPRRVHTAPSVEIDERTRERLRSLGYVE